MKNYRNKLLKESYKQIGSLIIEAGYKGIQFNRIGSGEDSYRIGDYNDSQGNPSPRRQRIEIRDKENFNRAGRAVEKQYPELEGENMPKHLERHFQDSEITANMVADLNKTPRMFGSATPTAKKGAEAFIGRPRRSRNTYTSRDLKGMDAQEKFKKFFNNPRVEVPYDQKAREAQRETIGHEAAHVRLSRLPGILNRLGRSETIASAYGGFRAPVRGSSILSRIGSGAKRAITYGIPKDISSGIQRIKDLRHGFGRSSR